MLYIAGYSRCGSTILDMVLNAAQGAVSTGELTYLLDDAADPSRLCTCGKPFHSCGRYGGWTANRSTTEAALVRRVESRAGLQALLSEQPRTEIDRVYAQYAQSLFAHIHDQTGAKVIVDSSKSAKDAAGRPLALARIAGLDVRVLHLTRDPRATIRSYLDRGSNWVLEGHRAPKTLESWRPILGWTLANRLAAKVGRALGPENYMHIRLEDILNDPEAGLARVGDFAGLDLAPVAAAVLSGQPFAAGHNVGGNRTRLKPQTIKLSSAQPQTLPAGHDLCLRLLGGKVARQFGYA
ncbi:MAG: sulfotransferase [Pseudomonadota bacterium]